MPVPVESGPGQLQSALSTGKRAVTNRLSDLDAEIADLDEAIDKKTRLKKPKTRTPLKLDKELAELNKRKAERQKQRDKLKKAYDKLFPPTKEQRILTAEQQEAAALQEIEKLEQQLKDIKEGKETKREGEPDLRSEEIKAKLKRMRERVKAAKKAAKEAAEGQWEGEGGAVKGKRKKGRTDAQKLKALESLLYRQMADINKEIADLEKGTIGTKKPATPVTSAKTDALKEKVKELEAVRDEAREASPEYQAQAEAKRLADYKKSQDRRLVFWQKRLADAEKGKKPKKRRPTPEDEEVLDKNMEIEKVQYEALAKMEENKRAEWNVGQWIGHGLLEASTLIPKALMLGYELSFFKRQAFWYARSHPIKAFAAAVNAIPAVFSQRIAFAAMNDIENRPNPGRGTSWKRCSSPVSFDGLRIRRPGGSCHFGHGRKSGWRSSEGTVRSQIL